MKSENRSETVAVKIRPSLKKKIEDIAKKEDRTVSYVIHRFLEKELGKYEMVA